MDTKQLMSWFNIFRRRLKKGQRDSNKLKTDAASFGPCLACFDFSSFLQIHNLLCNI